MASIRGRKAPHVITAIPETAIALARCFPNPAPRQTDQLIAASVVEETNPAKPPSSPDPIKK